MRTSMLVLLLSLSVTGCTWVHMAPGASAVRVTSAAPSGCEKRGEVEVSVKHSIAFIDRNQLRVREELETLARNEAPGLDADTIHPLGEPGAGPVLQPEAAQRVLDQVADDPVRREELGRGRDVLGGDLLVLLQTREDLVLLL